MTAPSLDVHDVTISPEDLSAALERGDDVVLLDVRHAPGGTDFRERYDAGHLPGAHYVDLPSQLAGPRTDPGLGNNPLPDADALQEQVRAWGINENSLVVVYTDESPAAATRAWWVLRWAGISDVRLLDGGTAGWVASGAELTTDEPREAPGDVTISVGQLPTIDADGAASIARDGTLLDARPKGAYVGGDREPGKPATGHIPGALSVPGGSNLNAEGFLKSSEELRAKYADVLSSDQPVAAYCGGGVGATLDILALASIGVEASLYPGSWSAWSADPERPVVTGELPG